MMSCRIGDFIQFTLPCHLLSNSAIDPNINLGNSANLICCPLKRIIMEFPMIFNANVRLLWADCCAILETAGCITFKLCVGTYCILLTIDLIDFLPQ